MSVVNTENRPAHAADPGSPVSHDHTTRAVRNPAYDAGANPESDPEGRPAHPEIHPKQAWVLVGGTVVAVAIASVIVLAVWGFAAGALVFVFGTALACIANPVMWASIQRDKPTTDSAPNKSARDAE